MHEPDNFDHFLEDLLNADLAIRNAKTHHKFIPQMDINFLTCLSKELHEAENFSKSNLINMIENHRSSFPLSPIFSDCTLLGPLALSRKETAITQVLAWLLSPNESHGLRDLLLCAFIKTLPEHEDRTRILKSISESKVEVLSEYSIHHIGRIDILIEGHDWAVIVEAKVDAPEGKDQTTRYKNYFDDNKKSKKPIYVFLTVDGSFAISDEFKSISYHQVTKEFISALSFGTEAPGFNYARLYIAGLLRDFCDVRPSSSLEMIIKSNPFKLEMLLSE